MLPISGTRRWPRYHAGRSQGLMAVRERLRAATLDAHERVDRCFSRCDFARPPDYRRFLEAHHAVLPGCEQVLAASGAGRLIDDWMLRVRTPALVADLADLGMAPTPAATQTALLSPAAAFGMLYVLEGSRLGGAVLARRVLAGGNPRCGEATRYLRHGEGSRLWPSFLLALEASGDVRDDPGAVVASAIETFGRFERAAVVFDATGAVEVAA